MEFGISLLVSFTATYFGVLLFRRFAWRAELVDRPNDRSSHEVPTPRGGGLVIVVVTILALNIYTLTYEGSVLPEYTLAGILVACVSMIDDFLSVKHYLRLAVHTVAACLVTYGMGGFNALEIPLFGSVGLNGFGSVLSVLWIVWLTNAYNFMDGIDGIAGLQAIVAGVGMAAVGAFYGNLTVVFFSSMVAASSLGFLLHNWQPAKIFMGDVGSAFLGFTFATLPFFLIGNTGGHDSRLPVIALVLVWPFVFDAVLTLFHRTTKLERVWQPHRQHIYQRLVISGWPHGAVAVLYATFSVVTSAALIVALMVHVNFFSIISAALIVITSVLMLTWTYRKGLRESWFVKIFGIRSRSNEAQ